MDEGRFSISAASLYNRVGTAAAPVLIDVRRRPAFDDDEWMIAGAIRRPPDSVAEWSADTPKGHPVVVYCAHGQEVSRNVAASLRGIGVDARYLEGGIAEWAEHRLPLRKKVPLGDRGWVTRERPKIDRIACPWLISRFINPLAEFLYVPVTEVIAVAKAQGATAYDTKDAEFGHVGDRCSFDAIIRIFEIKDPALDNLATIVRGADTARPG